MKQIDRDRETAKNWTPVFDTTATLDNPSSMISLYMRVLPAMTVAAYDHGYALTRHGSMFRDLDLVAIPWQEQHSDHHTLLCALQEAACGMSNLHYSPDKAQKPCGRKAYSFAIGLHAIVDVSITPAC